MRALVLAIALLSACVVVDDRQGPYCADGNMSCSQDDTVDICVDGYWEVYEDCWDACGGPAFCAYDMFDDPVCICD